MVDVIEESFYVSFYELLNTCERLLNARQCGVAASLWSEAMGSVLKVSFIDCFEYHSHNFLHKLIFKRGDAQRTFLSVFLGI